MDFNLTVKTADKILDLLPSGPDDHSTAKKWLRAYRNKPEEATRQAALRFFHMLPESTQLELLKEANIT